MKTGNLFTKALILLAFLTTNVIVEAQCSISVQPSNNVTINCGESIDLEAIGLSATPALSTDFNNFQLGVGWSTTATLQYNNPCSPSLDGTPSAWFGNVPLPRTLTTNQFDVACGGEICFDLDFGADDNSTNNCEDPDLPNEGVYIQYSVDGGITWVDIFYFQPTPNKTGPYYSWANYCFTIPPGAWSSATQFRWDQPVATNVIFDHWGIDNVLITPASCGGTYAWSHIPGTNDPALTTVSPTTTTNYTVTFSDGLGNTCTEVVTVNVVGQADAGDPGAITLCETGSTTNLFSVLNGTPDTGGTWTDLSGSGALSGSNFDPSVSGPGIYDFEYQVSNACGSDAAIVSVTVNGAANAGTDGTLIICSGNAPTDAELFAALGGNPDLGGVWTGPVGGEYTYTVLAAAPCPSEDRAYVQVEQYEVVVDVNATAILCNGGTSNVTVSASGGAIPYTGTGNFVENAGTYTYMVTDNSGCSVSETITITEPTQVVASVSATTIPCSTGTSDITVTATGGTGSYTGTGTFTEGPGTYTYVVTDGNGCSDTVSITVAGSAAVVAAVSATSIDCNGGTAVVTVSATGGTAPYSGTGNFTVTAGTHTYVVTDVNGCTDSVSITITEPSPLVVTSSGTGQTGPCTGSNLVVNGDFQSYTGAIQQGNTWINNNLDNWNVSHGTPSGFGNLRMWMWSYNGAGEGMYTSFNFVAGQEYELTYELQMSTDANPTATYIARLNNGMTPGSGFTIPSTAGTQLVSNVAWDFSGTTITVTETFIASSNYSQLWFYPYLAGSPTPNQAASTIDNITITEVVPCPSGGILCNGGTTDITVSATGGTAPYTGPGTYTVGAGSYTYPVVDANGCTETVSVTVTEPDPLVLSISATEILCNGETTDITVSATGGTAPYTGTGTYTESAGMYTYTVTDANGCTETISITVTEPTLLVASATAAVIPCLGATTDVTVTATGGTPPYTGDGTYNVLAGTYTYTVTDSKGCTSDVTITVTEDDNIPPTAICQDLIIDLDAAGNATITANDIDNGSSDACGIASLSISQSTFDCSNVGANTVTLTVVDNGGNTSTCTATVTVNDNVAPNAICQDLVVDLDAAGNASITAGDLDNGSSDACGIASLSISQGSFDCSNVGANTVTLTVVDNNGNSSTCTATVTVNDNVAPTAICQDLIIDLDAAGNASITAGDVDNGSFDNCGIASLSISQGSFDCSNIGANTVTLTVVDNNGNSSTCTATVTVNDNVAPNAICQDLIIDLDAAGNASITAGDVDNGSSDACGIASLSISQSSFDCSNIGANTVTLTVVDNNGNSSTCTATVTVNDNVAPNAICQDLIIDLDAAGNASIIAGDVDNGSSDACGIASLSISQSSFDCSNVGANTVTLTVVDNNGNSSTCTATVTVNDNVAPTAICQDLIIDLDATGNASITAGDVDNGSSDACGIASLSIAPGSFDCSNVGANTVTLTVVDNNGNTSTCTATVTVNDNIAPTAICQDLTVTLDANGNASVTASDIDNGSFDNCGIASLSIVGGTTSYTCDDVESTFPVTLLVTDVNGNTSTCVSQVTVGGTQLVASVSATEILCFGETTDITVTATGGALPYSGIGTFTEPAGTYSYTVTDAQSCTSDVTITVTEPTLLTASATATQILCNGETTDITVVASGGTAPYTGDGVYTELAGTYTYTVTDANGCTVDVTITVTEPTQLELDLAGCSIVYGGLGWAYACATIDGTASEGTPAYSYAWSTGEATPSITVCPDSTTTYSLTVTDGLGCTVTETWTVEVVDITCSTGGSSSSSGSSSNSGSGSSNSGSNSNSGSGSASCDANSGSGSGSGSSSSSGSSAASGPTYTSGPSCPSSASSGSGSNSGSGSSNDNASSGSSSGSGSGSSASGSGSGSSSGSSSSSGCNLPNDGNSNCAGGSSSSGNNGNGNGNGNAQGSPNNNNASVLMCFNGVTYCVKVKHIDKKLACGYTLGPCDMQQSAACDNSVPTDTLAGANCVCSGRLASITVRYIGPANGAVNASAKSCGVPISSTTGLNTGAIFYVNASDGGLQYLRNTTYLEVAGSSNGMVAIPTNCCNNPVGQTFFPFQVIGWVDTQGNTCGTVDNSGGGGGLDGMQTTIGAAGKDSELNVKKATISQFPNPASTNATFEFTVPTEEMVTLSIVNIRGELIGTIFSEEVEADRTYSVSQDISELQSGIYFIHMNTAEGVIKKKFVVLK